MRDDTASTTARGVALLRSRLDRPRWPTGDADAEARLNATLFEGWTPSDSDRARAERHSEGFAGFMVLRTRFFDSAVIRALRAGTQQIVVLGAGYDARSLRFRTPAVTFYEVDHPATQADKLARLRDVDAPLDGIVFVSADFIESDLAERLAAAGHEARRRSLFTCEGVLRYLPEDAFRRLLRVTAELAAPGSELAVSISTREVEPGERERQRERDLAERGEAVLTVPPAATAIEWLNEAGWRVASKAAGGSPTRARLLVRARPR